MKEITLEELLEAGCHFGHQVTRHNPKSRDFVFEARDNIHIIDLAKTKEGLEDAGRFIHDIAAKNGTLLIIGTKRQAQSIVETEIKRATEAIKAADATKDPGLYFVIKRWVGGILTNFSEVEKNFKKLKDFEFKLKSEEERMKYTKKELGLWEKERQKLESFYRGIVTMKKTPDAIFIIDTHLEHLGVREARAMGTPIAGIVDTNADPTMIDYPIPANDDAIGSIEIITKYLLDAWIEGKTQKEPSASVKTTADKKESSVKVEKQVKSKSKKQEEVTATELSANEKAAVAEAPKGENQDTTDQSPVKTKKKKKV